MKIRSQVEFEDFVASEYSWRRKELTNLRNIALAARSSTQESLIRSTVPIVYAHWEGFVKQTSIAKLNYLATRGFTYNELVPSFCAFAALTEFDGTIPVTKFAAIVKLVGGAIDLNKSLTTDVGKYIDTKSNLNSQVLKEIALKIDIDYGNFELKENFIDERFLGLRNKIAHGERIGINAEDFEDLYLEVTALIDLFKTTVLNGIATKSYLRK